MFSQGLCTLGQVPPDLPGLLLGTWLSGPFGIWEWALWLKPAEAWELALLLPGPSYTGLVPSGG